MQNIEVLSKDQLINEGDFLCVETSDNEQFVLTKKIDNTYELRDFNTGEKFSITDFFSIESNNIKFKEEENHLKIYEEIVRGYYFGYKNKDEDIVNISKGRIIKYSLYTF